MLRWSAIVLTFIAERRGNSTMFKRSKKAPSLATRRRARQMSETGPKQPREMLQRCVPKTYRLHKKSRATHYEENIQGPSYLSEMDAYSRTGLGHLGCTIQRMKAELPWYNPAGTPEIRLRLTGTIIDDLIWDTADYGVILVPMTGDVRH